MSNELLIFLLILLPTQVPAPVPRCSPFIIINKLVESNNAVSDSNPYFPVPPCEYGNPISAIKAGDYESVFILAHPEKVPKHNFYELIWFFKTGLPRIARMLMGKQQYYTDRNILLEGYSHYTPYVRTRQLGFNSHRNTRIIDDNRLFKKAVGDNIRAIITKGQDSRDPRVVHEFKGRFQGTKHRPLNFSSGQWPERRGLSRKVKYETGFVPSTNPL